MADYLYQEGAILKDLPFEKDFEPPPVAPAPAPVMALKFRDEDNPKLKDLCVKLNEGYIPGRGMSFAYADPSLVKADSCTRAYLEETYNKCKKVNGNALYSRYHNAIAKLCKYILDKN